MRFTFSHVCSKSAAAIFALLFIGVVPAVAASVTVTVARTQASAGQDAAVPISLKAAPDIRSMQFELAYDPAVLQFDKIENGPLASDNCLVESNDNKSGRLRLALVSQNGINGDGVLLSAHFKVVGQTGSKSALTPQSVRIWQMPKGHENMPGMNHLIDVNPTIEAGEVAVPSGLPTWPWLSLGAIVVLAILFMIMRRRSRPKNAAKA